MRTIVCYHCLNKNFKTRFSAVNFKSNIAGEFLLVILYAISCKESLNKGIYCSLYKDFNRFFNNKKIDNITDYNWLQVLQ